MKKTIAILMVLAIVTGMVFAGTATLSVKSFVDNKYPGFNLSGTDQATSGETGNASYASGWNDGENAQFAQGIEHGVYVDGSDTIDAVNSIAEKDIIVWFTLSQSGSEGVGDSGRYAKLGRTFDFDINVGNMTLRNQADTAYVPSPTSNQTVAPVDAVSGESTITWTKATVTDGNELTILDGSAEGGIGTSEFRVIYNGTVQDNQTIGTFKVKWPKKATLDEGKYQADVVVTITMS